MGKKNKPSRQDKLIQRRAARDIRLAQRPYMQEIEQAQTAAESAYGGYQGILEGMGPEYKAATADIGSNLNTQLGGLTSLLGGDMPQGEVQGATGMLGALGSGAQGILASQAQRNLGYQQSARREGGLAERAALDNLIQMGLEQKAGVPALIKQRVDELRDQALTQKLARSQMKGTEAMNEFMMQMAGGMINQGPSGRDRQGGGDPGDTSQPSGVKPIDQDKVIPGQSKINQLQGLANMLEPIINMFGGLPNWREMTPEQQQMWRRFLRSAQIKMKPRKAWNKVEV